MDLFDISGTGSLIAH